MLTDNIIWYKMVLCKKERLFIMKKLLCILMALSILFAFAGCAKTEMKTLHCDRCQKAVEVEASSNMEEDWILYCAECDELLFGGTLVVEQ